MADAPPELTEAQQAKLAAKQFKQDSRKLAKALKGKKPEPKIEAIDRCREDAAFLAKGECLVPLLQQCVFKKTKKGDNADVVQAALSCARAFLEAAPESQPDEEEGAATPEPPRATLLFEAAEKKKNKLSGGKLFADLLAHENGGIVVDAAACLRTVLKASVAGEEHPYLELAASGDPVGALVHMILQGTPSEIWPEEDNGVEAALEALALLIEFVPDASDRLVASGGGAALTTVACNEIVPEELAESALRLLDAATSASGGASTLLEAPGASVQILSSSTSGAASRLSIVERLLEAQALRSDDDEEIIETDEAAAPAPAYAFDGPGVATVLATAFESAESDAVAVAARCLGRAVVAFGEDARTPLLQTSCGRLLTALTSAPAGSEPRRCCEKALHLLVRSGPFSLATSDIDAAQLAQALSGDADAKTRTINLVAEVIKTSADDVPAVTDACLASLVGTVQTWADSKDEDPQLSPRGVEEPDAPIAKGVVLKEADAAQASLTLLRALGSSSPDILSRIAGDAREALDAALSRGPRTVDEFKRFDEAPVDDTAAPAPAAEAPVEDGVKEAVVLVRDPLQTAWDDAAYAGNDIAVRSTVMALLAQIARSCAPAPVEENDDEEAAPEQPGEVSSLTACAMLLDILCVDLVQKDGAPYWGAAAADEDELVREDVRAEALDLLAAVGADENGRKLLLEASRSWVPSGMTQIEEEEAPAAEDEEVIEEQFAPPENLADQRWWPYVHVLAAPVCVAADPTATAAQHTASVELIRALCSDDARPKDDQSLVCDRFAATACAMGVLVPLCALASEQTAICVARFCVADEDFDPSADFAATARAASKAVADLAGRAYEREKRIATYAADAYEAQFAVSMVEGAEAFEAQLLAFEEEQAEARAAYEARVEEARAAAEAAAADEDCMEAEAPIPAVEPLACAPAPAFDDRAARRAATEAAEAARNRVVDARGGPTNKQWATYCLDARAPDLRRRIQDSTALLAACAGSGEARTCSALLARCGGDASVPDNTGRTPSMAALLRGSTETIHSLLEAGCDADVRSEDGTNVLLCAFVAPNGDALDTAINEAKAQWELTGSCPSTVLKGSGSYVEAVLQKGADPDVPDGRGKFPLHWCVEGCAIDYEVDGLFPCSFTLDEAVSVEMLSTLLAHGASPDVADLSGCTALHSACRRSNGEAARLLLQNGAQMNLSDGVGRLPVHLACAAATDYELVAELLESGQKKPRGTATHDGSRAGLSKSAKTRRNVIAAMDRALQAALAPDVVVDVLPSPAELASASDSNGYTMLHYASQAPIVQEEDVWSTTEPVSAEERGAFLAQLAARDDVVDLHAADSSGRDAVCLAIEQLGDHSLQFVETAVSKGYDVERELELPDEDLDLPYRPAWETPSDPPPGFAGDADADLFDDLDEPEDVSPEPSEDEPGEATLDALETYLKAIFDRVDSDQSGAISAQEALAALRDDDDFAEVLGVDGRSKDDVLAAITDIDADGDARVSWAEFRAAALGEEPEPSEEAPPDIEAYLRAIFDRADADGSGEISTREAIEAVQTDEEFAEMMGFDGVTKIQSPDDRSDLEFAIAMLDADGNEKVSWGEFREAFLGPLTEEPEDPFEEYLNDYEAYLETVFDRVDKNKDGTLSYAELVSGLKDPDFAEEAGFYGSGMSRGEFAAEFCDALDWDGDRTVDWFEFRDEAMGKALDQMHELRMEQALREVFDRVDESGDGAITIVEAVKALREDEDFADVLGFWSTHKANRKDGSMEYVAEQIQAMDVNNDGVISWEEFRGCVFGMEPVLEVVEEERAVGNWLTVAEDVATTKARRCSPLHMAACTGAQRVMSYLIDQGAPAYGGRPNPIALAALKGCAPEACELLESALPGGGRAPDPDLGGEAPAQAAAARGFAATALALGAKGLTDPQGRTCALIAARRGEAGCVAVLLENGCDADGSATPSLLEGAIDSIDADVVKVAVQHVSVTTHDVLRAETIHAFWAERLMSLERDQRDGSTPQIASDLSAAAYRLVAAACTTPIGEDAHVYHCFAEGRVLAEELLAKEKARLRAEERNRAATSIQKQARGRNRRRAMRDAAAGKSKKDKKSKKKRKGKK
ncbi:unnamed protein product [Pelagomonas calceolata]|uniref:EF-hand domain-containing protein n=1 Tax=Pelagomonas calceolata TaxID=35677 RepID=A0A8J2SSI3_9STRA|nr:unnamed protein product [Pelagomonas calceolata]